MRENGGQKRGSEVEVERTEVRKHIKTNKNHHWKAPPEHWLKYNTDGSWKTKEAKCRNGLD